MTSGRIDTSLENDIFTDLGDLPGTNRENMAGESLAQKVRRKNAEKRGDVDFLRIFGYTEKRNSGSAARTAPDAKKECLL